MLRPLKKNTESSKKKKDFQSFFFLGHLNVLTVRLQKNNILSLFSNLS